jgi:AraC-like DNA-binding protein
MPLYSSLATIVLAFLLIFFNRQRNANALYLFLMLLFVAIHSLLQASIMNKGPLDIVMIVFNNFSPLYFLIGPMLFFYVRGTLKDNAALTRKDYWHFVPAIIVLANVAPYWVTSTAYKYSVASALISNNNTVKSFDANWLIPSSVNFVVRGLQMLAYVLVVILLLFRYAPRKLKNTHIPKIQEKITFTWLKILVSCMLIAIIGYYSSSLILVLVEHPEQGVWHTLFVIFNYVCFVPLLIIPLALLTFPQILYGIPALHIHARKSKIGDPVDLKETITIPIKNTDSHEDQDQELTEDKMEEGLQESARAVMDYLIQEKPYLDKDFTMDKLVQALNLPRHHVYFCMNRVLKVKFPELRKKLRIEYAKELLEQGKNETLTIEGIGTQSGFSSRSNFFSAFKSEVGCTPSEYLERVKTEIQN